MNRPVWQDERFYPAYLAAASLVTLGLQGVYSSKLVQRLLFKSEDEDADPEPEVTWLSKRGGAVIFAYKFLRLLTLVTLLSLTIVSASHVGWSWFNIAGVLTLVRPTRCSPVTVIVTHGVFYSGIHGCARCSQCSHKSPNVPHLLLPPLARSTGHLRALCVPRHMAPNDLHPSPRGRSRGTSPLGKSLSGGIGWRYSACT